MRVVKTKFKGLIYFQDLIYSDKRGSLKEIFTKRKINKKFDLHMVSQSRKNVIRGLHLQKIKSQGKFVSVIKGKIFDVAVDLRKNSKTFGQYFHCTLSEKNSKSVFIPPGFAHGFQALEKENYIIYSCTEYRHSQSEKVIQYNDKELNIKWPSKKKIISEKDNNAMSLRQFIKA